MRFVRWNEGDSNWTCIQDCPKEANKTRCRKVARCSFCRYNQNDAPYQKVTHDEVFVYFVGVYEYFLFCHPVTLIYCSHTDFHHDLVRTNQENRAWSRDIIGHGLIDAGPNKKAPAPGTQFTRLDSRFTRRVLIPDLDESHPHLQPALLSTTPHQQSHLILT